MTHAPGPSRIDDRRIAVASIVVAAMYLIAAAGAAVALATGAPGALPWLPLHLALTGGASTAIAGVMPFFVAALAGGWPAPAWLRGVSVALVAIGAALIAVKGFVPLFIEAPLVGGIVYLVGMAATAVTVLLSGRGGLMVRRPIVTTGYLLALLNVAIGGVIGTLIVAGWTPALERLFALRAAHVWTNLAGFVSLVIIATLLHFLPTVLRTRIVSRPSAVVAVLATAFASPLIALGLSAGINVVTGAGAVLALIGAGALVVEARAVRATRGVWTFDRDWHFVASASLLASVAWFAIGMVLASALVLARAFGLIGDDRVWSSPLLAGPLAIGWVAQAIVGSWTHLLPAMGPGTPVDHARQRSLLGLGAGPRVVALNVGTACVSIGWPLGISQLTGFGALLVAVSVVSAAGLAVSSLRPPRRQ
jgi:hypothetical protein